MSSVRTIQTRQNSEADKWHQESLKIVLSNNRKAKGEVQGAKAAQETRGRDPAIFLGEVAWRDMSPPDEIKITDSSLMDQFQKGLTKEQIERLTKNIKGELTNKKEEFCSSDDTSSLHAKTQLTKLMTPAKFKKKI